MLVVTHVLQMLGEKLGERCSVRHGFVLAALLPRANRVCHALRRCREDVRLVELCYGAVDDARPLRRVDAKIGRGAAWWNGEQKEVLHLPGFRCGEIEPTHRVAVAILFLEKILNMERLTLLDGYQ